jgi:hypothetical protein
LFHSPCDSGRETLTKPKPRLSALSKIGCESAHLRGYAVYQNISEFMTLSELEKACRELREKTGHDMVVVARFNNEAQEIISVEDQVFDDIGEERLVYAMLKPSDKAFY